MNLIEVWENYTPAGWLYKKLDEAAQYHVYVANATDQAISVIVSANREWAYLDLAATMASLCMSMGTSAPSGITALRNAKSLYDIYQATRIWAGTGSVANQLWSTFAQKGTVIQPKSYDCVNKRSASNPLNYLSPSQWAALEGGKDLDILIFREDGRSVFIESNSDNSWVTETDFVHLSESGTIWQPSGEGIEWGSLESFQNSLPSNNLSPEDVKKQCEESAQETEGWSYG